MPQFQAPGYAGSSMTDPDAQLRDAYEAGDPLPEDLMERLVQKLRDEEARRHGKKGGAA